MLCSSFRSEASVVRELGSGGLWVPGLARVAVDSGSPCAGWVITEELVGRLVLAGGLVPGRTHLGVLRLLVFKRSVKSINAQEERLAISPLLVTRVDLPYVIEVRFYVRKSNVVTLTPEKAGSICV